MITLVSQHKAPRATAAFLVSLTLCVAETSAQTSPPGARPACPPGIPAHICAQRGFEVPKSRIESETPKPKVDAVNRTESSPSSSLPAGLFGVLIDRPVTGWPNCPRVPVTADSASCVIRESGATVSGVAFPQSIVFTMSSTEAPDWLQRAQTIVGSRPTFRAFLWDDGTVALIHALATSGEAEASGTQRFGFAASASKGSKVGELSVIWKLQGGIVEYRRSRQPVTLSQEGLRHELWAYGERWEQQMAQQQQRQDQQNQERERQKRPL